MGKKEKCTVFALAIFLILFVLWRIQGYGKEKVHDIPSGSGTAVRVSEIPAGPSSPEYKRNVEMEVMDAAFDFVDDWASGSLNGLNEAINFINQKEMLEVIGDMNAKADAKNVIDADADANIEAALEMNEKGMELDGEIKIDIDFEEPTL